MRRGHGPPRCPHGGAVVQEDDWAGLPGPGPDGYGGASVDVAGRTVFGTVPTKRSAVIDWRVWPSGLCLNMRLLGEAPLAKLVSRRRASAREEC